ncbi:uncharacterized protein LOC126681013 [Mercurialis annua]|uniref:uncharacterized protein LOC126681013 n=1 Tax=Mercurialis annua TaxID=3986 RepID=UPI00215F3FF0|nr:uncharacterized protein LOC126681013 [Mercurialis annua]
MGRNKQDFCPFLFPSAVYGSPSSSPSSTSPPSSPPPQSYSDTHSSSHHYSSSLSITSPFKLNPSTTQLSSTADAANLNRECTEEITVHGASNTLKYVQDPKGGVDDKEKGNSSSVGEMLQIIHLSHHVGTTQARLVWLPTGDAENTLPPSKKRAAEREISRDNPGLDDDEGVEEEMGTFKRASDQVLAGRRIVKVRRKQTSSTPSSNPFAGIRLVPPTEATTAPAVARTEAVTTIEKEKRKSDAGKETEEGKDETVNQLERKTEERVAEIAEHMEVAEDKQKIDQALRTPEYSPKDSNE